MLGACSQSAPPPKAAPAATRPDVKDVKDVKMDAGAVAVVARIRAAGAQFDSSVEVKPLRDAAVEGLLKQAHDYEAQQQAGPALDAVAKALKIAPNAPDILQYQAELQVEAGEWKLAAASAQRSYDLGPKVGALCARNLQTLVETNNLLGDPTDANLARQRLASCKVPAPVHY
jgi:tetratricopeptide (TPR) repeat protein